MTDKLLWMIMLLAFSVSKILPQEDSIHVEDSLQSHRAYENLLEQSAEDSPVIDVIADEAPRPAPRLSLALRSRIIQKLQQSEGYADGTYLGSSLRSYHRLTSGIGGKCSGGILVAKDAGEPRMNEFSSWNLCATGIGGIRAAVAGSYRIEAGQGIALWRGYDFSKGADVVTPVKKKPRGLVSALSTDEAEYFKGAAAEVSAGQATATAFYSRRELSASFDALGNVTTLYQSGYFRTQSEQSKRNNLAETLYGAHLSCYFSERDHIGLTCYRTMFSSPLLFDEGRRFSGIGYSLIAVDYTIVVQSATLFGEWARVNSTLGGMSGIRIVGGNDVTVIASVRSYPHKFVSLHGLGFGEGSSTSNENGVYLGMKLRLMRSLALSLYCDQFSFPQKTSVARFSVKGNDVLAEIHASPSRNSAITIRYHRKLTEERSDATTFPTDVQRVQRVRLQLDYDVSRGVKLRGRVDRLFLDWKHSQQREKGLMMYQDIAVRWGKRLWWNIRISFFQTDAYSSRIYAYERDLEGVLSLPALYGTGIRWYGAVRYDLGDHLRLTAKYSDTIRDDVKHIGTGLDELPTNHDNRAGVQLDVRY